MLDIGKAIRLVRQAKGVRQGDVAKAAKISVPFLSLIEAGIRQPSLEVLRRIANGLNVPAEALVVLAQPTGGTLDTSNRIAKDLAESIKRLAEAETALQAELGMEPMKNT